MGCTSEDYDSGDGRLSYLRADFVDAHADARKYIDNVCTDEGEMLTVGRPFTMQWITKGDSIYRALLYYNKVYDGQGGPRAEALSVERVPVVGIVPVGQIEQQPADPVVFESVWLSANGRYVNIAFAVKAGKPDDDNAVQTVFVVDEGTSVTADGRKCAGLRLCHDQGGVPEYYTVHKYVSILTSEIDADIVRIRMNTYSGEIVKDVELVR